MKTDQTNKPSTSTEPKNKTIFEELRDKVDEIDREEGLQGPYKQLKQKDGTNAFDQVLEEIAREDEASGGKLSGMIDFFIEAAEKEMGIENMGELIGDNMEKMNEFAGTSEGLIQELMDQAADSGYTPDKIDELMSGVQDFIKTGGDNGGIEKIIQLVIDQHTKDNPDGSAADPLIDKMKEIVNNDELSAEKEAENLLREFLEQNQSKLKEAMKKINLDK